MPCCSLCNCSDSVSFSFAVNQSASAGLSFTSFHQHSAQMMAGAPSRINIHRQPTESIKYPDKMDIHKMVTGLPRIRKVLALDLSALVNHRLNKISMAGITALSVTPNMKRMMINRLMLLIMPVAIARAPQSKSDQKINFLALLLAAYRAPGT